MSEEELKLCKDCKYCEIDRLQCPRCYHDKSIIYGKVSLIDGLRTKQYNVCSDMREAILEEYPRDICGIEARLFEPREQRKLSWFDKLFGTTKYSDITGIR